MSHYFKQDYLDLPDGASLYYQVHGAGAPGIVLCDGLGCDGFAWKYLQAYLRRAHRVVRWHYRGHGRSGMPRDAERIGMHHTCEDLARLMDTERLERAVLFGHSMGVQVALEFHRRYAPRVAGLVLICGSYGTPLDTFHDSDVLRHLLPLVRELVERFPQSVARLSHRLARSELALQLALRFEANRQFLAREDLLPYFRHLACMDPRAFVRTLDSLAAHSAWEHLPHVDVPTLVVGGERDRFTPVRLARAMAEAIPGAELLRVPQGTHTATLEQPELIELRVERFLREHGLQGSPGQPGASAK